MSDNKGNFILFSVTYLSKPDPEGASPIPFKLINCLDQAPTPDHGRQSEMLSHFVNVIYISVTKLNRKISPTSTHPYFGGRLLKAIPVKTLFDTGADISCIRKQIFHALLLDWCHIHQPIPSASCQGANRQHLHTMGVHTMNTQIGRHMVNHPFQVMKMPLWALTLSSNPRWSTTHNRDNSHGGACPSGEPDRSRSPSPSQSLPRPPKQSALTS